MTFTTWKAKLARELCDVFNMTTDEAARYVDNIGDERWFSLYEENITPADAAAQEAACALDCLAEDGL